MSKIEDRRRVNGTTETEEMARNIEKILLGLGDLSRKYDDLDERMRKMELIRAASIEEKPAEEPPKVKVEVTKTEVEEAPKAKVEETVVTKETTTTTTVKPKAKPSSTSKSTPKPSASKPSTPKPSVQPAKKEVEVKATVEEVKEEKKVETKKVSDSSVSLAMLNKIDVKEPTVIYYDGHPRVIFLP